MARIRHYAVLLPAAFALTSPAFSQSRQFEEAPLFYSKTAPGNSVARLEKRIATGAFRFNAGDDKQFLAEFLHELNVPVESQVLVFSKTSKQNDRISPETPRAIYFSEECYIGWVPGGMIEIGCSDPELGAVFYLLEHRNRVREGLRFDRPQDCLNCHAGSRTRGFPGFLVRSVYPDETGMPLLSEGSFMTGHESPLEERWGGWYVTGCHGAQRHMGNTCASLVDGRIDFDTEQGANLMSLDHLFPTDRYLVPGSDILALMVLEHQVEMHNRLNRAAHNLRRALYLQKSLASTLGETSSNKLTGSALSVAESQAEKILEYMLFCEEAPLEDGGVDDGGEFREAFLANRRDSADGRSLKDFQLLDRLFKYRCSYMIYSTAFDSLPGQLKQIVYRRLWNILNGRESDPKFQHLSESERSRIREILVDTKDGLPGYWKRS